MKNIIGDNMHIKYTSIKHLFFNNSYPVRQVTIYKPRNLVVQEYYVVTFSCETLGLFGRGNTQTSSVLTQFCVRIVYDVDFELEFFAFLRGTDEL